MTEPLRARRLVADSKESLFSAPRPTHAPSKSSISAKQRSESFVESFGGGLNLSDGEGRVLAGLLLLGALVRFWRLDRPSSVVYVPPFPLSPHF